MKRQLRNRRSASTCSNYSQSSSSLIQLQPVDMNMKQKKFDYNQIEKQYLGCVYSEMKHYNNSNKSVQPQILNKWKQILKIGIKQCRQVFNYLKQGTLNLRTNIQLIENNKSLQIRNLKIAHQEQMKIMQNQVNKRIMDISSHFGRKEQQYKDTISKFIDTLHKSQKNWSKIYTQMSSRIKKTQQILRQRIQIQNRNLIIYEQIELFAEQFQNQHQDSFRSINLSCDQLAPHINNKLQQKRNTIDISSIQQIQEVEESAHPNRDRFQDCLIKMIFWGFFTEKNQKNIKKIIQITKNLQNPESIVHQPIFPILIQSIKIHLELQKQISIVQSNNNSVINCQNHSGIVIET